MKVVFRSIFNYFTCGIKIYKVSVFCYILIFKSKESHHLMKIIWLLIIFLI